MNTGEVEIGAEYQHYKGGRYLVKGIVRHSETLEEMVHYEALYKSDMGQFWVRPIGMWNEIVEVNGEKRPRFALKKETSSK